MGSRKDLILAPAIKSKRESSISQDNRFKTPSTSIDNTLTVERNVDLILNRYVDYNDTPVIFDFYNEYENSFKNVQQKKICPIKLKRQLNIQPNIKSKLPENTLLCDEKMPETDEELPKSPQKEITSYVEDSDDSVLDKDYNPEDLTSSESDDEINYCQKTAAFQTSQAILPLPLSCPPECSSNAPYTYLLSSSPPGTPPRLSPAGTPPRQSAAGTPPRYSPPATPSLLASDFPLQFHSRSCSPTERSGQSIPTILNSPVLVSPPVNAPANAGKGFNKAGLPRKRRIIPEPLSERKKKKQQLQIKKLDLKSPCKGSCHKKCSTKFTLLDRENINKAFCTLDKESQGIFIKGMVDTQQVKTRKVTQKEYPKRSTTYIYHLKKSNDDRIEVCKSFFLTTLGYNVKNDCRVLNILKRSVNDQKDRRGKYIRENKIDRDIIKNHVLKYNPAISHYRREHAPKKLYLPSDINMTEMYKNFCQTEPNHKVSIETYRHVVKKEMNISFANLGNEECEQCAIFQNHNKEHTENQDPNCDVCKQYLSHKNNYTTSRINYKLDAENSAKETDTKYYSVDLQKVIMLPRLEQYKAAIFCSRIIAFNESFVPLGKSSKNLPLAVLWNETVSGRSSQDILSAYRVFFLQNRDTEKIMLWADNCSSQNKNWGLFSFLVNIINSNQIATNTIEIKYFEPGHTFMSADQFHHLVEKSMRHTKVYDFDDYVSRVKGVNSMKTLVKQMDVADFYEYDECVSQHKIRNLSPRIYLKDITHVKVERGLLNLKFKIDQNQENFQTLDFLQNKVIKSKVFPGLKPKTSPRGITEEKKKDIIEKLVPLMPQNRQAFWYNLPTSNATNLLEEN